VTEKFDSRKEKEEIGGVALPKPRQQVEKIISQTGSQNLRAYLSDQYSSPIPYREMY
jgi:hypothetical protein